MEELKPCPFCGGKAKMEKHAYFGFYVIGCTNFKCLTKSSAYKEKAEAIKAWNTRNERTCTNVSEDDWEFECSECGAEFNWNNIAWGCCLGGYCACCGAKVVD